MSRKSISPGEKSNDAKAALKKVRGQSDQNVSASAPPVNLAALLRRAKRDPASLTASEVQELQRTLGNRGAMSLLRPDLAIGSPGDQYEQEADRVADQVVTASRSTGAELRLQEEEEELVEQRPLPERLVKADPNAETLNALGRVLVDDEGKTTADLRRIPQRPSISASNGSVLRISKVDSGFAQEQPVSPLLAERIEQGKGGGSPLPATVQRAVGEPLGYDFSDVRVKTDAEAADLSRQLGARAFTQGRDIWLGQGESADDTLLMAHELTHVAQQGAAPRLERRRETGAGNVPASDVLEHLRGMLRGDAPDASVYREAIARFRRENPSDRLAFLQRQILGSPTASDITHKAKPGSISLCGGGGGTTATAPPTFPTINDIAADATVERERAADWAAGQGDYAERFAWITWNADTKAFSVVGKKTGTWEGVTPGPKPADSPPTYRVGEYHQHPPLPPAEAPDTANYPVGPSTADRTAANNDNSPGIVRDFTDTTRRTVRDYPYGPNRRA